MNKGLSLLLLVPCLAAANDGWWSDSSSPHPFGSKHKQIQMVKEHIDLKLTGSQTLVTVTFLFKNHGPDTSVTMGFPESQKSLGGGLDNFRSWVDDKEVDVTHRVLQDPHDSNDEENDYKAVWLKTVAFKTGQARVVKVRYFQRSSYSTFGTSSFDYVLRTGATWRGMIEEVLVTFDYRDAYGFSVPYFVKRAQSPIYIEPVLTGEQTGKFVFKDVEPYFNLEAHMCASDWNVWINKTRIDPFLFYRQPKGDLSDVMVPVDDIGNVFSSPQPYAFEKSKPWGLYYKAVDIEKFKLKRGLVEEVTPHDKTLYVYLKDVVEALGGTYRYDPENETVFIAMPTKPN